MAEFEYTIGFIDENGDMKSTGCGCCSQEMFAHKGRLVRDWYRDEDMESGHTTKELMLEYLERMETQRLRALKYLAKLDPLYRIKQLDLQDQAIEDVEAKKDWE